MYSPLLVSGAHEIFEGVYLLFIFQAPNLQVWSLHNPQQVSERFVITIDILFGNLYGTKCARIPVNSNNLKNTKVMSLLYLLPFARLSNCSQVEASMRLVSFS